MAKIAASGRLVQGEEAQAFALPDRVEAIVEREGRTDRVWLDRATDVPDRLPVPAGGFMRARHRTTAAFVETLAGAAMPLPHCMPMTIKIGRASSRARVLRIQLFVGVAEERK